MSTALASSAAAPHTSTISQRMGKKAAKKLPSKIAKRWKKRALKEAEEEARWASLGKKAATTVPATKKVESAAAPSTTEEAK